MVTEAIARLSSARGDIDEAAVILAGGGRVEDAAPICARAVEELCAALAELAWSECDRAVYGDGDDECQRR